MKWQSVPSATPEQIEKLKETLTYLETFDVSIYSFASLLNYIDILERERHEQ